MPSRCRLLVVDDNLQEAERIGLELQGLPKQLLNGEELEIELTNSASFAASRLSADPLFWDVILSDVFMPAVTMEPVETRSMRGFRCWKAPLNGMESFDHGGMYIARRLLEIRRRPMHHAGPRLALISSIARRAEHRQTLRAFELSHNEWFRYWDKTNWDDAETSADLISPRAFKFALIQAVTDRHRQLWGAPAGFSIDVPVMQEIEIDARKLGSNPLIRNVFVTGPPGSGKRSVANLMHAARHSDKSPRDVEVFECLTEDVGLERLIGREIRRFRKPPEVEEGALHRAIGGTLYIAGIESAVLSQQKLLFRILKESYLQSLSPRRRPDVSLTVWSTELSLDQLRAAVGVGTFDNGFLTALMELDAIHMPALRDRAGEIPILGESFVRSLSMPTLKVAADVWPLLAAYEWPGNVRELKNAIGRATSQCTSDTLTAKDFAGLRQTVTARTSERRREAWQTLPPGKWAEDVAADYYWHVFGVIARARTPLRLANDTFANLQKREPALEVIPPAILKEVERQIVDGAKSRDIVATVFARMHVPGPASAPALLKRFKAYKPGK